MIADTRDRYQSPRMLLSQDANDYNNRAVEFRLEERISNTNQWRVYEKAIYTLAISPRQTSTPEESEMSEIQEEPRNAGEPQQSDLDYRINLLFGGVVVRKDLVKAVKGNAIVPSYVLEYLLGPVRRLGRRNHHPGRHRHRQGG